MDNSDAFGSSTAPLTWHDFLERMRHPSATDFVKAIKSFIVSFLNNAPDAERDSIAVQEFLSNMESAFRAHTLWAGSSEEDLESAGEGLEKYVMTKLFTRVFASVPEDVKADEQLSEKMALVQQFIRPENLDIKPTFQNEASWLLAQKELQKMNMYKAPRDKLVCILHCCKVISNLLLNASLASNGDHPGADEFLPVLIYVTIKANPPQLHSNLSYIQRFRRQNRLVGEAAYFFTNMLSVESFVSNIDAKALSMDELEFEKNMESAQLLLSGLSESSDQNSTHLSTAEPVEIKSSLATRKPPQTAAHHQSLPEPEFRSDELYSKDPYSLTKSPSIPDLENKGAAMLLKEDEAGRIFREFPYLYTQASDLVVGDVEDLLNSYKQLVFKYVCLAKGMGVTTSATPFPPPSNTQKGTTEQPEVAKTEQPKVAKDSETVREVDPSDDLQKELAEVVDNSGFGSESVEKKVPEEAIVEAQSEENSQR